MNFNKIYSIVGTHLDSQDENKKIIKILEVLNDVPIGSANNILEETSRLIKNSISKVDTSLIVFLESNHDDI